jgi:hypothetical protein
MEQASDNESSFIIDSDGSDWDAGILINSFCKDILSI